MFDYRLKHTPEEFEAFVAKLRVYENGAQDDAGAWINREFPDIHWIRSIDQTKCFGGPTDNEIGLHTWKPYPYTNVPASLKRVQVTEKQYEPYAVYTDAIDHWIDPETGKEYNDVFTAIWPWRQAMWNDIRARMDWCVKPYNEANHHPVAVLNGDITNYPGRCSRKRDPFDFRSLGQKQYCTIGRLSSCSCDD